MPSPRSPLASAFAVVASALRLLWRHWPALLALALAGFSARQGFLTLAVKASALHAVVGLLVFAMVPLSMLVALILMMRVARSSLPDAAPASGGFTHFASVLLPFLAVYAAYDYFEDDRTSYIYGILMDETFNNVDVFNNPAAVDIDSRMPFRLSLIMLSVAAAAFLLRWSLGRLAKTRSHVALGFSRGYLEATWLTLGAVTVTGLTAPVFAWAGQRQAVAWVAGAKDAFVTGLGPLSSGADWILSWFGEIMGSIDAIIIVPLAWLTIGCVAYGHKLVSPSHHDPAALEKARRRWQRLPAAAQALLKPVRNDAVDRFGPMIRGLRVLRHAGLPTMLLFCLAFLVAQSIPHWLWELERMLIGPRDLGRFWIPLSGPLSTVNFAVGSVLTVCLVTAAAHYVLTAPSSSPSSSADAQPGEAGQLGGAGDPDGSGLGVAGRDEEDRRAVVG